MPTFRIELRGAKPTNGHAGEPEITAVEDIEDVADWYAARECGARRFGIDVHDPAMRATLVEPDQVLEEPPPTTPSRKQPASKRGRSRGRGA